MCMGQVRAHDKYSPYNLIMAAKEEMGDISSSNEESGLKLEDICSAEGNGQNNSSLSWEERNWKTYPDQQVYPQMMVLRLE